MLAGAQSHIFQTREAIRSETPVDTQDIKQRRLSVRSLFSGGDKTV